MPITPSLLRVIFLSFIIITNIVTAILAGIAFHDKTGGGFQALALCISILTLLFISGCICHKLACQDEESSNTRNVCLFGICGLLGTALAVSLTVHARQDGGTGICNDFAHAGRPCVPAGVQLGMAYVGPLFAWIAFGVSWFDKFPGAVKVTPRYPITKAPSSHFAAHGHDLDESYTRPPMRSARRSRNNSDWSDVPLDC